MWSSTSADGLLNIENVSNRQPFFHEYRSIHSSVFDTVLGAAYHSFSDMPRLAVFLLS